MSHLIVGRLRLIAGQARSLDVAFGDLQLVFAGAFQKFTVGGLGAGQRGLRCRQIAGAGLRVLQLGQLRLADGQTRLRLSQSQFQFGCLQAGQQIAAAHRLSLLHQYLRHPPHALETEQHLGLGLDGSRRADGGEEAAARHHHGLEIRASGSFPWAKSSYP